MLPGITIALRHGAFTVRIERRCHPLLHRRTRTAAVGIGRFRSQARSIRANRLDAPVTQSRRFATVEMRGDHVLFLPQFDANVPSYRPVASLSSCLKPDRANGHAPTSN